MPCLVESDEDELGMQRIVRGIENAGTRSWAIGLSFVLVAVGCIGWETAQHFCWVGALCDPLSADGAPAGATAVAPSESLTEALELLEGPMKSKFVTNSPWKSWRFKAGKRSLIDTWPDHGS
eukprot:s339_g3.t1